MVASVISTDPGSDGISQLDVPQLLLRHDVLSLWRHIVIPSLEHVHTWITISGNSMFMFTLDIHVLKMCGPTASVQE